MFTYHDITMHNDIAIKSILCITMPQLWYYCYPSKLLTNESKTLK